MLGTQLSSGAGIRKLLNHGRISPKFLDVMVRKGLSLELLQHENLELVTYDHTYKK